MASTRSRSASQALPITVYEDESAQDYDDAIRFDEELEDEEEDDDEGFDEEDPFSTSELSQLSNTEGNTVIRSIEGDDNVFREPVKQHMGHRSSHSHDLIHLDDHFEAAENAHADSGYDAARPILSTPHKLRGPSDGWRNMPEEMQYYRSPLPGQKMLTQRSPLSATKSHLEEPMSPSPVAHRQSLLSSPIRSGSPQHSGGQYSPTRNQSNTPRDRPVFRNPSSVRAMQMASPPPFSTPSPKSARHRRQASENARSRQGTPSRHSNPAKEYPLVLLHCTLTPLPSTFQFTPGVLEAVLPEEKLRDVALLKEKLGLGTTVLERGVLIPHPQEDYELLEERILESLELKKPRVGACGHFLPDDHATIHEYDEDECDDGCEAKCWDCNRHVHPSLLEDGEFSRRWDVRIYAANGLMRAGAWSAAWREMEKVDVEVGIWFSDTMRRKLEEKAREEMQGGVTAGLLLPPQPLEPVPNSSSTPMPNDELPHILLTDDVQSVRSVPASTATMSARSKTPVVEDVVEERSPAAAPTKQAHAGDHLPLSILLQNYLLHLMTQKKDLLLGALVIVMGLVLARSSLVSTPAQGASLSTTGTSTTGTAQSLSSMAAPLASIAQSAAQAATTTVTEFATATGSSVPTVYLTSTVTWTTTETVTVAGPSVATPACTVAPSVIDIKHETATSGRRPSKKVESAAKEIKDKGRDPLVGVKKADGTSKEGKSAGDL